MDNDTSATPQAGNSDNLQPQAGTTPSTTSQADARQAKTADDYERMLAELRKENAGHRTRLKKFEEEANSRAEAQLSKEQLLEKQYNELKAQHEEYTQAQVERLVSYEVRLQAASLGVNPKHLDKVSRLIDWEELDIDEQTGGPTNVRETLEKLLKEMPELLLSKGTQTPTLAGGATNPSRSQSTAPQALSWEVIGKMKSDEYEARRGEIQAWIAANPHRYGSRLK